MCGCTGKGKPPASPVRASILREPAGDIGARRSVVNTCRDGMASRWSLRKARSSPPPSGWNAGHAVLDLPDVQQPVLEVDLIPAQRAQLGDAQPVAVGDPDHGGIAVPAPVWGARLGGWPPAANPTSGAPLYKASLFLPALTL